MPSAAGLLLDAADRLRWVGLLVAIATIVNLAGITHDPSLVAAGETHYAVRQ